MTSFDMLADELSARGLNIPVRTQLVTLMAYLPRCRRCNQATGKNIEHGILSQVFLGPFS